MNAKLTLLYAFLGGTIVGAGAAVLFAPEKGADTRRRIKELLHRKGICCKKEQIDQIVAELEEIAIGK